MENQKVVLNLDNQCYKTKPPDVEVGALVNRLKNEKSITMISIAELSDAIGRGQTFTTGILKGKSNADWTCQQIFAIDVDNKDNIIHPKDMGAKFKTIGLDIAIFYHSFSSTLELPKYRFIFVCSTIIEDAEECRKMNTALVNAFAGIDPAPKNLNHMYYGTDKTVYVNNNAKPFDKKILLDLYAKLELEEQNKIYIPLPLPKIETTSNLGNGRYIDIGICIDDKGKFDANTLARYFDLLGYIRHNFSIKKEYRKGRAICINPCPICGHLDCFMYLPDTNTFHCFSCGGAGTVTHLIRAIKGFNTKEAIDYIKYDICELSRKDEARIYNTFKVAELRRKREGNIRGYEKIEYRGKKKGEKKA